MMRNCPACGMLFEDDGDRMWTDSCPCGWATPERRANDARNAARFAEVRAGVSRARRRVYAVAVGVIACGFAAIALSVVGTAPAPGGAVVACLFWGTFIGAAAVGLYETWVDSRWVRLGRRRVMRRR